MPIRLLTEWLLEAFTGEASAQERKRFASALWRIVVAAHIFWAWGVLGPESGFATAEDVDNRVSSALTPYVKKLEEISLQLEKDINQHRQTLIREMIVEIRDLQRDCMASPPDSSIRARLSLGIDLKQQEYQALTGREYPVIAKCE